MQISFAKLGNIDEILMFFSYGNKSYCMKTEIFRISNIRIEHIGTISGQRYMYIDYNLNVPIGGQGIVESYAYSNGRIYGLRDLLTDYDIKMTE